MQITVPNFIALEEVIFQVALARFGEHVRSAKNIAPAIVDLSNFYNAASDTRGTCPNTKYHQAGRLTFFTLADLPKAFAVAAEADTLQRLPLKPKLKILDVGAGYGAQSLGLLAYLAHANQPHRVQLDVVDRDNEALETLAQTLEACQQAKIFGDVALNSWRMDVTHGFQPRDCYDIIIIGNTFCELPPATHYPLLVNLISAITETGLLFVIEPALKASARPLHHLRDQLLAEQHSHVLAPCTRQGNCPCLSTAKDWCHESRQIVLPPRARHLAAATGLRMHDVKWSYLTLMRTRPETAATTNAWRVVSDVMTSKGKHEVFVCGPAGRLRAVLQTRDHTSANKPLKKLQRGQFVSIDHAQISGERLLLGGKSLVSIDEKNR